MSGYCLIGKTLSHSYSATLHRGYGLDYTLQEVAPDALERFVRTAPYDGFNVTIPYKRDVIPYLDRLSPLAAKVGAVNTVVRRDGLTIGYNTDYAGLLGALDYYGYSPQGKTALVLGTGGAGTMACTALKDKGAVVQAVSRTGRVDYANCYDVSDVRLIVNATPVGTYPDQGPAPVDVGRFPHLAFVYDLVYNPFRTQLISDALDNGVQARNGLAMLVIQALAAREIWTGVPYADTDIKKCIRRLQNDTVNLALTGMPSCGKTTIGRALAAQTGKTLVDTDVLIEARTGRTPQDIILQDGEPSFRQIEAKAVEEACAMRGVIIALGGGAVLLPENRARLRKTAMVVYVRRDLSALTDADRPTLAVVGAQRLFTTRDPIYRAIADCIVPNDGTVEQAVRPIIEAYENFGN